MENTIRKVSHILRKNIRYFLLAIFSILLSGDTQVDVKKKDCNEQDVKAGAEETSAANNASLPRCK